MKRIVLTMSMIWLALPVFAQDRPSWAPDPESTGIRDIQVSAKDKKPITLNTKIRITTVLVLPEGERVVRKSSGDIENWVIDPKDNDTQLANMLFIKPTQAGGPPTNLNVLTTTGALYSFWLVSITKGTPDLRVTLLTDPEGVPAVRKWVPVAEFDAVQGQLIETQAKLEALQAQVAEGRQAVAAVDPVPVKHFDYSPVPYEKPFKVKAIYHDGKFTYIQTDAAELPTVYELKDGKPSALDPHPNEPGVLTIYKIVDEGVLVLGSKRQTFKLVKGN